MVFLFFLIFFPFLVRADETVVIGEDGAVLERPEDTDSRQDSEEAAIEGAVSNARQAEVSRARATVISLFGKNAVIAIPPQMKGSVDLPPFDSEGMTIGPGAVKED